MRAQVRTYTRGLVWELWWRGEILAASTNQREIHEAASLINAGRP